MTTEKQKMLAGAFYDPADPELQAEAKRARAWMDRYNAAQTMDPAARRALLVEGLGAVGEGAVIRPPFFCDYASNITLGAGVFLNFNCVILDVARVRIGDLTQIGPAVQIMTADHPRDPGLRQGAGVRPADHHRP